MRERDNSTPRTKRTPIVAKSGGGAARISGGTTLREGSSVPDEHGDRSLAGDEGRAEQRSVHRTKRPPPLPSRKAHKIKRIKSQRSTPWAALEPEVRMRQLAGQPPNSSPMAASAAELADMPMHALGATTLIRRETQLIDAERERAERERVAQRRQHQTLPLEQLHPSSSQDAPSVARPGSDEGPDRRWLVLLKVGRDELAGIWDGSLESCEPSVWRPATKTWAPLFEVPQIATLVTATVKQRQANPRASVPASPAPRRPQSSAVLASGGRRSSVPPAPGQLRAALASMPDTGTSGSSALTSGSARNETLRPSSLAELGGTSPELSPAARLTMRAPYIPPPPRVPNLVTARLPVQPAFTEDSASGTVPADAVAALRQPYATAPSYAPPPYGAAPYSAEPSYRTAHAHQAAQAFAAAEEAAQPSYSETRAIPLTRRLDADVESPFPHYPPMENSYTPADGVYSSLHSQPAADSYAPHAHTITPLTPPRPATLKERAGWLFAGVAAALLLTTFTGLSSSMREGLADWIEPKPGSMLASALLTSDQQARATASGAAESPSQAAEAEAKRAQEQAQAREAEKRDDTRTVSVDDLPVLTRNGELVRSDSSKGKARSDETSESSRESHASLGARAHSRQGVLATSTSVKLSSLPHGNSDAPTERPPSSAPPRPASKPQELKFDAAAARRALASAVGRAQFCSGERARGTIVVTFAPAGGVASVSLASIDGTDVRKGCVVNAFKGARIMPFHGDPVTVQKSFQLR